jgi:hypothetical protein
MGKDLAGSLREFANSSKLFDESVREMFQLHQKSITELYKGYSDIFSMLDAQVTLIKDLMVKADNAESNALHFVNIIGDMGILIKGLQERVAVLEEKNNDNQNSG